MSEIMRHGDFQLIETGAICRSIDASFGGPPLMPAEARAAARMEIWSSAVSGHLYDDLVRNDAIQCIVPAMRGQPPSRPVIDATLPEMEGELDILDRARGERERLAGDAPSLADLFIAPIVHSASLCPEGAAALERCRNLARAFGSVARRDSSVKVTPTALPAPARPANA